jgi:hypothetical protein
LVLAPRDSADVTLELLAPALAALLAHAAAGTSYAILLEEARARGAEQGEDTEIVTDLLRDGLLVATGVFDR